MLEKGIGTQPMKSHRLNKETGIIPQVVEIVLIIGNEKNRGEWRKGKVVRLIKGKDDVVRGVTLLHKRHTIYRPLQLVCPLEIRALDKDTKLKNHFHSLTRRSLVLPLYFNYDFSFSNTTIDWFKCCQTRVFIGY